MKKRKSLYGFDRALERKRMCGIVGVDEAGRGPLAGPVVAAAVQLDLGSIIRGVDDSKKLTAEKREALYDKITARAVAWATGAASVEEIDSVNILHASLLAMQRALDGLSCSWGLALIDGNQPLRTLAPDRQQTVVDGDALSVSIAAASIVAKVTRDRMMAEYDIQYPGYGFGEHKGYATLSHRRRILDKGVCPIHRRTFCSNLLTIQTCLPLESETFTRECL